MVVCHQHMLPAVDAWYSGYRSGLGSELLHAPPTRVLPRLRHVVAQCRLVHLREQSTTGRGVSARMRVYVRGCVRTSVGVSVRMRALA